MSEQVKSTETGIDITTYIADRSSGIVAITKPVKASGNYIYMRSNYSADVVDGVPTLVEKEPILRNINRQSLVDVESKLAEQEAGIANVRAALEAISADMDAADAH